MKKLSLQLQKTAEQGSLFELKLTSEVSCVPACPTTQEELYQLRHHLLSPSRERSTGSLKKGKTARSSMEFAVGRIFVTFCGTNRRAALKAATLSLRSRLNLVRK